MEIGEPIIDSIASAEDMSLRILWWNINLAPLGNEKKCTPSEIELIATNSIALIDTMELDILCVGEAGPQFLEKLEDIIENKNLEIYNGIQTVERVKFDTAVIYNSEKLKLTQSTPIVLPHVASKQKICHRLVFTIIATQELLFLHALHWPSRLNHPANTPFRDSLGGNLRTSINQIFDAFGDNASVVLIGDFNDEPYNNSMATHLLASRDRDLVRKRSEFRFFYNPFWRFLTHPNNYVRDEGALTNFGTYYYSNAEELTNCYVFDQILFSSAFINKGPWHLNEESIEIINETHKKIGNIVQSVDSDHLPVYAEIRRKM